MLKPIHLAWKSGLRYLRVHGSLVSLWLTCCCWMKVFLKYLPLLQLVCADHFKRMTHWVEAGPASCYQKLQPWLLPSFEALRPASVQPCHALSWTRTELKCSLSFHNGHWESLGSVCLPQRSNIFSCISRAFHLPQEWELTPGQRVSTLGPSWRSELLWERVSICICHPTCWHHYPARDQIAGENTEPLLGTLVWGKLCCVLSCPQPPSVPKMDVNAVNGLKAMMYLRGADRRTSSLLIGFHGFAHAVVCKPKCICLPSPIFIPQYLSLPLTWFFSHCSALGKLGAHAP